MVRRRTGKRRGDPAGKGRRAGEGENGKPTGKGGDNGKSTKRRGGESGGEWIKSIFLAVILFFILRLFIIQTFVITSGSMENTLLVGDFLVVNRAAIGSRIPFTDIRIPGYSEPRRGDVLVFDPHHEENMTLVKRLVGMPGDTLEMRDKVLYLNGVPQDEPYVVTTRAPDGPDPIMRWQREYLVGGPRDD